MFGAGNMDISHLRGLGRSRPVAAAAFTLGAMSFIGMPFTAGFSAKRLLLGGLLGKGWYVPLVLVLVGSAVALVYCGRVVFLLFAAGGPKDEARDGKVPMSMSLSASALALSVLALGILSYLITPILIATVRIMIIH
jgi:multicomponent Na+:H+ antiporter subunit D